MNATLRPCCGRMFSPFLWHIAQMVHDELEEVAKRVYLFEPHFFVGHYIATDNALLVISISGALGVAAGILLGSLRFSSK